MKNNIIKPHHLVVISAAFYSFLFWKEDVGINLLIYSLSLMTALLFLHPVKFNSPMIRITAAGTLLTGIMVVWMNSSTAVFAHIASFYVFVGFYQQPALRSIHFSLGQIALSQAHSFMGFRDECKDESKGGFMSFGRMRYLIKIVLLPLLFLTIFYTIYLNANEKFANLSSRFWSIVAEKWDWFFGALSFDLVFLFISGLLLSMGVLIFSKSNYSTAREAKCKEGIERLRDKWKMAHFGMNALRTEYRMAITLLILMNALLLVVNYTDIKWVWLSFDFANTKSLSQFVHEGTYLLILSILLSQGFIIYYFRGNLNFIRNNRFLLLLANAWMLQNIILTISVGMRNYHYVEYYALAYKRLGVFIFLALVVVGLITMVVKINQKRTGYYLIRVNALTVYLVMVVISCANWDNWIIAYNLKAQHKAGFDVAFCHELSDKTIPYVLQNLDVIEREITKEAPIEEVIEYDYFRGQDDREKDLFSQFKSTLLWRAERFVRNYESNSWASWNYQDHMAYEKLKNYFKNEAANSNIDQRSFSMIK